ncbi:MAG: filamentous hemagglutinin N-terminal domain-containing protein [Nostoc sp.]|uniref:two-partner secretion domain-containing protein n=1 Tax=Nostoc sp. TaxID=1180 RepID=UPI002FF4513E
MKILRFAVTGWLGCVGAIAVSIHPTFAQLTPDNSLGKERSQVIPLNQNNDGIVGGAARGTNLFHSFQDFNVGVGRGVYFANPEGITNIFSRVTGGNSSNIFGSLGVLGNANLFLLNPNGILFGKKAQLDMQGSFMGTTANGVQFRNQGVFSATNPEAPPLLTINPSALLFNQINQNASIQNNSVAPAGKDPGGVDVFGLRVPDGNSLLLVGGNVSMDGGWAIANGGRIELGGLVERGSIGIQSNGDNFSLSFPDGVQRGDISLNNKAIVGVIAGSGGSIAANTRNLEILAGSQFFAGIGSGLGTANTQAGDITVDATGEIKLAGANSLIFNSVQSQAVGNAGNITIKTGSLEVTDGAQIVSSIFGKGDSGNISITASDAISLDKTSYILNNVQSRDAEGNARNIDITTGSLTATNGAEINSFTRGRGNAGNIMIKARDAVTFDGKDSDGNYSGSFSNVLAGGVGNGGKINITASSLSLTNNGQLGVGVREAFDTIPAGKGIGGRVDINVRDAFTISGTNSGIFADIDTGAVGSGGNIQVEAGNIFVTDGGLIRSSTFGKGDSGNIFITARDATSLDAASYIANNVQSTDAEGNAGNIDITTGSLSVTNGAEINSFTRGRGNAGNITIQARHAVTFDGKDSDGNFSASYSSVLAGGVGNGGKINITAGSLSLTNNGQLEIGVGEALDTIPAGEGKGGTVDINVRDAFTISGTNSGIFGSLGTGAIGRGGDIKVEAGNIFVIDGGEILSSTFGKGDSGNISITARDAIFLDQKGIYNNVQSRDAEGNAGNIDITTGSLSVTNGAEINSFTRGRGNAGNITIQARDAVTFDGVDSDGNYSSSSSNVLPGAVGNGGDINLQAGNVFIKNGGEINSSTFGEGDAGKISITARDTVSLSGQGISWIRSDVGFGGVGNSGGISISTGSLFASDEARIFSSVSGRGNSGGILIEARDTVSLTGVGDLNLGRTNFDADGTIFASSVDFGGVGNSGGVVIKTGTLRLDSSQINASTAGRGNSGNILIEAQDQVALLQGSDMFSEVACACEDNVGGVGGIGNGGDIRITTGSLLLDVGANLRADTEAIGNGGNIIINARDSVTFRGDLKPFGGGAYTQVEPEAVGKGGSIIINTPHLSVSGDHEINTRTQGQGDAGNIFINANSISLAGSDVFITSGASQDERLTGTSGKGGDINITTNSLLVTDGAKLSANTEIQDAAGNININASRLTLDNRGSITSESIADANGGNIKLNLKDFLLMRHGSQISTTAGNAQAGGNGGNININSKIIAASPEENSDISANAYTGTGGRVQINAQGIFGIEARPKPTKKSDITASSELGVSGITNINAPDTSYILNSFTGLFPNVIDTNALIANSCIVRSSKQKGTFFITGSGALRSSPGDGLISNYSTGEVRNVEPTSQTWKKGNRIVEPQGLYRLADGRLVLSRECQ